MIGKRLGNRYEIQNKVGGGGMALVYRARDLKLDRIVAIKVLRPEFAADDAFVRRFKREAQAAAKLSHPNIVNIYDVGEEDSTHYIVMEYVNGKSLKEVIKKDAPLATSRALDIAVQVCRALIHAHKNQVIHRDIKPHNILITASGKAKVADFGIAQASTAVTLTRTDSIIGSVHYFSPEQARGSFAGERSDIYSLCIVLYEMLTGRVPFEADSAVGVAVKHIQEKVPPPSSINPRIPPRLERIILKGLAKEQRQRYTNASGLLADLESMDKTTAKKRQAPVSFSWDRRDVEDDGLDKTMQIDKHDALRAEESGNIGGENTVTEHGPRRADRRRKSSIWPKVAAWLIILLSLVGLGIWGWNWLAAFTNPTPVEVPNLIGMSNVHAQETLNKIGLRYTYGESRYSADIRAGHVMEQKPEAGEIVVPPREVELVLSLGREIGQVPDVVGKTEQEARVDLENAYFEVGEVTEEYHPEIREGHVISQDPRADLATAKGTKVNLVISKGPEPLPIEVPELTGLDPDQAGELLASLKLRLGRRTQRYVVGYAPGTIVDQSPRPGQELQEGGVVDIYIQPGQVTEPIEITFDEGPDRQRITVIVDDAKRNNEIVHQQDYERGDQKAIIYVSVQVPGTVKVYRNEELILEREF